jgi:hypothetical protein
MINLHNLSIAKHDLHVLNAKEPFEVASFVLVGCSPYKMEAIDGRRHKKEP